MAGRVSRLLSKLFVLCQTSHDLIDSRVSWRDSGENEVVLGILSVAGSIRPLRTDVVIFDKLLFSTISACCF